MEILPSKLGQKSNCHKLALKRAPLLFDCFHRPEGQALLRASLGCRQGVCRDGHLIWGTGPSITLQIVGSVWFPEVVRLRASVCSYSLSVCRSASWPVAGLSAASRPDLKTPVITSGPPGVSSLTQSKLTSNLHHLCKIRLAVLCNIILSLPVSERQPTSTVFQLWGEGLIQGVDAEMGMLGEQAKILTTLFFMIILSS